MTEHAPPSTSHPEDRLASLLDAGTAGEWLTLGVPESPLSAGAHVYANGRRGALWSPRMSGEDAALIVALHNSAAALIEVVRAAREIERSNAASLSWRPSSAQLEAGSHLTAALDRLDKEGT